LPTIESGIDLAFIDADKTGYLTYYNLILDKLRPGGYIIADNVLWSGKVVEKEDSKDADTAALKKFNRFVQEDERVENTLLPVRDGLMLIRKK
jgi:caffeoyl-CoA O-methyltransferase